MQPELIITPFGESADPATVRDIPQSNPSGAPRQNASWEQGFPLITMTPIASGGIPPEGPDMNGVLRAISRHASFVGGGGQYKWSAEYVAAKGGYPKGAVIQADNGEVSYVSTEDGNSTNFNAYPDSIGKQWVFFGGATSYFELQFEQEQEKRESEFNQFLINTAFEMPPIPFVEGSILEISRPTQLVSHEGQLYSVRMPASFPVILSDIWDVAAASLTPRSDEALRQQLEDPKGASLSGWLRSRPGTQGTVASALDRARVSLLEPQFASLIPSSDKPDLNDPSTWLWDAAGAAFFAYCMENYIDGEFPAGDLRFTPGILKLDSGWVDRPMPFFHTAPGFATRLIRAADVDAPMIEISNGTATSARYNLWRGGGFGSIDFVNPFTESTAENSNAFSIYGVAHARFAPMRATGFKQGAILFKRKLYGANNPDPYNVYDCTFEGIDATGGRAFNNDNFVGLSHNQFWGIRVADSPVGAVRGIGTCNVFSRVSVGNCAGYAWDAVKDLITCSRNIVELLELDNIEKGFSFNYQTMVEVKEARFVHRFKTGLNTADVYWPTVCFDICSVTGSVAQNIDIKSQHRYQSGGTVAALGVVANFNNNNNAQNIKIRLQIDDESGLGIPNSILFSGLSGAALNNQVTRLGATVASTNLINGSTLTVSTSGTGNPSVPGANTGGFPAPANRLIFPVEIYNRGSNYSSVTGYFTAPYGGIYQVRAKLSFAVASGARVRIAVCVNNGGTAIIKSLATIYASSASEQTYQLPSDEISLAAGDQVYLVSQQDTQAAVLLGVSQPSTSWSIRALH